MSGSMRRQLAEVRSVLASDPQGALQRALDLLLAYPNVPDVLALAAECCLAAGDPDSASKYARQALQVRPGHGRANLIVGQIAENEHRMQEAVTHYRKALRSSASRMDAHRRVSEPLFELASSHGDYAKAIRHLRSYLHYAPDDFDAWMTLGWQLFYVGKWELSDEAYARAMATRPDSGAPYVGQSRSRHMQGLYADAMGRLRTAIEIDPGCAKAYERIGAVKHSMNDYSGAVHCTLYSLQLDQSNLGHWWSLLYALDGQMSAFLFPGSDQSDMDSLVREVCEAAIGHVTGESQQALMLLHKVHRQLGNYDEVSSVAQRYLELYPDSKMARLMQMRTEPPADLPEDDTEDDEDDGTVQEFLCAFGHLMPGSPVENDEIAEIRRLWGLFLAGGLSRPDI
jgi:tetratricopeptide (TPR) repeat protein